MKNNVEVRQAADAEAASAAPEEPLPLRPPEARATSENTNADTTNKPTTAGESTPGRTLGKARTLLVQMARCGAQRGVGSRVYGVADYAANYHMREGLGQPRFVSLGEGSAKASTLYGARVAPVPPTSWPPWVAILY